MPIFPRLGFLRRSLLTAFFAVALVPIHGQAPSSSQPVHVFFRVQAPATNTAPISGRLLIFLKAGSGDPEVSVSEFHLSDTWVCAREVHDLAPGASIEVNADEIAYPRPFSALQPGIYEAQPVLASNHNTASNNT